MKSDGRREREEIKWSLLLPDHITWRAWHLVMFFGSNQLFSKMEFLGKCVIQRKGFWEFCIFFRGGPSYYVAETGRETSTTDQIIFIDLLCSVTFLRSFSQLHHKHGFAVKFTCNQISYAVLLSNSKNLSY